MTGDLNSVEIGWKKEWFIVGNDPFNVGVPMDHFLMMTAALNWLP
jgi:hypothetical protein